MKGIGSLVVDKMNDRFNTLYAMPAPKVNASVLISSDDSLNAMSVNAIAAKEVVSANDVVFTRPLDDKLDVSAENPLFQIEEENQLSGSRRVDDSHEERNPSNRMIATLSEIELEG